MKKESAPEARFVIYTNEERNKFLVDAICELIAEQIFQSKYKQKTLESC